MSARATWKGLLTIRLVTIPIKVFPATESSASLSFNQLHETCQTRITQRKWCVSCGREVPSAEIVKGFEFEKGRYVLLLEAELDAVQPLSAKVIDLVQFAPISDLPLTAIDRAYFLAPDGDGAIEAYGVFRAAMSGRIGIGKLAIYGREYLVAVGPQPHGGLMLFTLHHAAELRASEGVPSEHTGGSAESAIARQIVASLTRPLNLADFTDQYQTDLRRLIDAKIAGEEIIEPLEPPRIPLLPLHEALTQSLAAMSAMKKTPAKAVPSAKRKRA